MGPSLSLVLALSMGAPLSFSTPTQVELERGIRAFEDFKDTEAAVIFHRVLDRSPPGSLAAKARVYLGLIALNALDLDEAKVQFRHALEADPAAVLPRQAPPKAQPVFDQVRHDISAQAGAPPAVPETAAKAAPAVVPEAAPAAAPETGQPPAPSAANSGELLAPSFDKPPLAEGASSAAPKAGADFIDTSAPKPASSSHVASYVLIAATAVLTGVAIYGGYEVASYNSMVAAGNSAVGSGSVPYSASQISSNRGPASFWAIGWPVTAVLAAAGGVGAVLTW